MTDPENANIIGHYQCSIVYGRSIHMFQCSTLEDAKAELARIQAANAETGLPAVHKAKASEIIGPGPQLADEVLDLLRDPAEPVELP
jgi:hypothetical protein